MIRQGFYVVSAGGGGIGLTISREIADRGGIPVILDPFSKPGEGIDKYQYFPCDASDPVQVDSAISELVSQGVPIEGLVNCAGISGPTALVEDIASSEWQEIMKVNVLSCANLYRNIVPVMKKQRRGAIVSISSSCTRNGFPLRSPYVVSKAAVEMMSETMAMELGPWGIRSNVVSPGIVEGARLEEIVRRQAAKQGIDFQEAMQEFTCRTSMKTAVSSNDVARTVRFLLSDDACHISGQKINVCGNFEGYSSEMVVGPARQNGEALG